VDIDDFYVIYMLVSIVYGGTGCVVLRARLSVAASAHNQKWRSEPGLIEKGRGYNLEMRAAIESKVTYII